MINIFIFKLNIILKNKNKQMKIEKEIRKVKN